VEVRIALLPVDSALRYFPSKPHFVVCGPGF
jgi:hypothetical protein